MINVIHMITTGLEAAAQSCTEPLLLGLCTAFHWSVELLQASSFTNYIDYSCHAFQVQFVQCCL